MSNEFINILREIYKIKFNINAPVFKIDRVLIEKPQKPFPRFLFVRRILKNQQHYK